jgi:hypothetical protein
VAKYRLGPPWGARSKRRDSLTRAYVKKLQKKFDEEADGNALLQAIDLCFCAGLQVPLPLRQAFCDRFLLWASNKVQTLDEAFSVQRPSFRYSGRKRLKFKELKERSRLMPLVVGWVSKLRSTRDQSINSELFEIVAEELGISASQANKLYYHKDARGLRAALGLPLD